MLPLEQRLGFILAGVVAAGSIAVAGIGAHNGWAAAAGVAASAVLYFAVRKGHRVLTAMAGFLAGLAFFYFFPLELACLGYSFYLMMRNSNAQAKARRTQPHLTPAERRAAAAARATKRSNRRGNGAAAQVAAPKTPIPNRRYTPPKARPARPSAKVPDPTEPPKAPGGPLGKAAAALTAKIDPVPSQPATQKGATATGPIGATPTGLPRKAVPRPPGKAPKTR